MVKFLSVFLRDDESCIGNEGVLMLLILMVNNLISY